MLPIYLLMTKTPHEVAIRSREALDRRKTARAFTRETFSLPRQEARAKARDILKRYPVAGYGTVIESWAVRPGDIIEFTIRRVPTAD